MRISIIILALLITSFSFAQEKKYTTYRVSSQETISSIARKIGVTPYDLLKLNPDAKDGITIDEVLIIPNKNYKKITKTIVTPKIIEKPRVFKDSIINGILYHTVKPYETIYSLAKKYKNSKRKVRKLNKLNRKSEISTGQVLKFHTKLKNTSLKPLKKVVLENLSIKKDSTDTNYIIYNVKSQDTFYSLERAYHITEEELKKLNPNLINGLKTNSLIKIPKTVNANVTEIKTVITETKLQYKIHTIAPKEGFYRLKVLYDITKEELIELNPDLDFEDGLKLGMKIKVPVKVTETLLPEGDLQGKFLNLVMILPFKANSQSSVDDFKNTILLHRVTDFYLGSLVALDSLKAKGLSINLTVLDSEKNPHKVAEILNTKDFSNTNLVIGPVYYKQFKQVAMLLDEENIPMISPLSKKDLSSIPAKNIIQNMLTQKELENKMLDHIITNYTNQNLIIISDEKTKKDTSLNRVITYLKKNSTIKNITILRMEDDYIKPKLFEDHIKEKEENWVILVKSSKLVKDADFESTISVAVNLGGLTGEFDITLFAITKPKFTDNIKLEYLNLLKFQYPTTNFIDENNINVVNFKTNYKARFNAFPTEYSFKGYDTTYDALIRLANYENFNKSIDAGNSKRLESKFHYKLNTSNNYSNTGSFIVKYEDFKLVEVNIKQSLKQVK